MDFGKLFSLFVKHPTIFRCWCFSLWSVEPKVCDLTEIWVFSWIIYIWVLLTTLETCVEEIFFGESLKRQEFFIDFKTILWHCRDLMFYADDTRINTALYNEHSECSMMLKFQVRDSGVNGWCFFFSLSPFSCNFLLFFYRLLRRNQSRC